MVLNVGLIEFPLTVGKSKKEPSNNLERNLGTMCQFICPCLSIGRTMSIGKLKQKKHITLQFPVLLYKTILLFLTNK